MGTGGRARWVRLQVKVVFQVFVLKVAVHLIFAVVVVLHILVLPTFIEKHDVCLWQGTARRLARCRRHCT